MAIVVVLLFRFMLIAGCSEYSECEDVDCQRLLTLCNKLQI